MSHDAPKEDELFIVAGLTPANLNELSKAPYPGSVLRNCDACGTKAYAGPECQRKLAEIKEAKFLCIECVATMQSLAMKAGQPMAEMHALSDKTLPSQGDLN